MESVLQNLPEFEPHLSNLQSECDSPANPNWFARRETVSGTVGVAWEGAIGGVSVTLNTTCACRCLIWEASFNDPYNFDPVWSGETHRTREAERAVRLVRIAQVVSQCGWEEFNHVGTLNRRSGSGCQ